MKADLSGLDRLVDHLKRIGRPNPKPLIARTIIVMGQDNRKGVLAGLDKDGRPMDPVTYRPVAKAAKLTDSQRNTANRKARKGGFGGLGPMAAGLHNNLSSAEYRKLGGPPLAPRGAFSRVITNYMLAPFYNGILTFGVIGTWQEVVNAERKRFLHHLFKKRDLRGVRPDAMRELRRSFVNWAKDEIRYRKAG